MPTIDLPLWGVLSAIGVPCFFLLSMTVYLLRRMRVLDHRESDMPSTPAQDRPKVHSEFQQDLLAMQIDTLFNGLVALIETERLRAKSMLDQSLCHGHTGPFEGSALREALQCQQDCEEEDDDDDTDIGRRIVEYSESGMKSGEIGRRLGISQAEVSLALKMMGNPSRSGQRKLEAVA